MEAYCTSITINGIEFKRTGNAERDTYQSDGGINLQKSRRSARPWAAFRLRKDGSVQWLEDYLGRVRTFKTLETAGSIALSEWPSST